jgi:hypothetical protein
MYSILKILLLIIIYIYILIIYYGAVLYLDALIPDLKKPGIPALVPKTVDFLNINCKIFSYDKC